VLQQLVAADHHRQIDHDDTCRERRGHRDGQPLQKHGGRDQRDRHDGQPLEQERRAGQLHTAHEQPADADHRGQVERVGSDQHPDADPPIALGQGDQSRGDLRPVGRHRGEEPDQCLGKAKAHSQPVQSLRQQASGEQGPGQ